MDTLLETFFTMLSQVKLYHWATMEYGVHKALDELHSTLSENVDSFVEIFIGRYKKQPLPASLTVKTKIQADVQKLDKYLESLHDQLIGIGKSVGKETQLLNILDEMIGAVDRTQYLIRLK
jgi:DNA-binding ferritin-like protein